MARYCLFRMSRQSTSSLTFSSSIIANASERGGLAEASFAEEVA